MIPPRSPYGLIQEDLWPDGWRILVACMLLNCTTRKAVEKVIPKLFRMCPDAASMASIDPSRLAAVIAPLGFKNRRSKGLIAMSTAYIAGGWIDPRDLPGIGDYAGAAWDIFVKQTLPAECPKDHALTYYWRWRTEYGR